MKWRENEVLRIEDLKTFDKELKSYHSHEKQRIEIANSTLLDERKGKILYMNCQDKDIKLAQQIPPARTVQGTYQVLSNNKELGWHPDWIQKLEEK